MAHSLVTHSDRLTLLLVLAALTSASLANTLIHLVAGCVNVVEMIGDNYGKFHALCASKNGGKVEVSSTRIAIQSIFGHQDEEPKADPLFESFYSLVGKKSELWIDSNMCLYDTMIVFDPTWQAIGDCPPAYYQKKPGKKLKIPNPYYFWYHQQGSPDLGEIPDQDKITGETPNNSLLSDSKNPKYVSNLIDPETDSTPQNPTSESTKSPLLEYLPNSISDSVSPENPQTPDNCFSNCGDLAMSENQPAIPVKNRDIENSDVNALDSIITTSKRRRSPRRLQSYNI